LEGKLRQLDTERAEVSELKMLYNKLVEIGIDSVRRIGGFSQENTRQNFPTNLQTSDAKLTL
jgi:hypothetical protein